MNNRSGSRPVENLQLFDLDPSTLFTLTLVGTK